MMSFVPIVEFLRGLQRFGCRLACKRVHNFADIEAVTYTYLATDECPSDERWGRDLVLRTHLSKPELKFERNGLAALEQCDR